MLRFLRFPAVALAVIVVGTLVPTPAMAQVWEADVEQRPATPGDTVTRLEPFEMIAVSWTGSADLPPPVEVLRPGGWEALPVDTPGPDAGPDDRTAEARADSDASFSEPVWVDSATGYRVGRATGTGRLTVHLIRQHRTFRPVTAETRAGAAAAPPDGPPVNLRAAWGAAPPKDPNGVAKTIRFAVVHHTAGSNDYTQADVPAILRGIQSFHQNSRGWNDIAYNFLVDKYGGIWEGRAGGIGRPIIGSHAANFNTGTVGISLLGTFTTVDPTPEAVAATAQIAGWKLAMAGVRPDGTTTVVGTADNVFPTGATVTIPTIVGHSDVGTTDCPGRVRNYFGAIRTAAAARAAYVVGRLDVLASPERGKVRVNGWGFDRRSGDQTRVVVDVNGATVVDRLTDIDRPDIRSTYPAAPARNGFDAVVDLTADTSEVCVYLAETSYGALTKMGCSTFVSPVSPKGRIDRLDPVPGGAVMSGWAYDPDTGAPTTVRFTVDGAPGGSVPTTLSRLDVVSVLPTAPVLSGWTAFFGFDTSRHEICATAVNVGPGADTSLGCRTVGTNPDPLGTLDGAFVRGSLVGAFGWALDRDAGTGPSPVLFFVNNRMAALANANLRWPVLAPFFPENGVDHGFFTAFPIPKGRSTVCAYAIGVGPGAKATNIGCRTVVRSR